MAEAYQEWLNAQAFGCLSCGNYTAAQSNPFGNAFDGSAFYASHTLGSSTINTLDIGPGTLAAADLKTAVGVMRAYKGDGGRWLNVNPNILCVPPSQEFVARDLLVMAPGMTTVGLTGRFELVVSPYLSGDAVALDGSGNHNNWYLIDGTKQAKPIIYQRRTDLEFTQQTQESYGGFMRDEWAFGVRVRCAFGYGAYWLAGSTQVN
jgi:phage major head subunit gpT-like protein